MLCSLVVQCLGSTETLEELATSVFRLEQKLNMKGGVV
jgi:hypothetical protein